MGNFERKTLKTAIIGVDPSVSSSSLTTTIDEVPAKSANSGLTFIMPENQPDQAPAKPPADTGPFIPTAPTPGNVMIESVEAYFRILLTTTLALVDTSIPNKDQNRAFKHLFRKAIDQNFVHLHNLASPPPEGYEKRGYQGATPADYVIQPMQ